MPDQISTPTKPGELICFYPIAFPIKNEEDAYLFIAVDAVSAFLFQTGMERTNDIHAVLRNVQLLMDQDLFRKNRGATFTLVLHKYQQHKTQIEAIIKPYGGKVAFNDAYLTGIVTPPMKFLFEKLEQH